MSKEQIYKSNGVSIKQGLPIFLVGILLILVFSMYLFFPTIWTDAKNYLGSLFSKKTSISSEIQVQQGRTLLSNSQINFSKITKITPIAEENVSKDFMEFVLPNAVQKNFNEIEYEKQKTGTFSTYLIQNTDIRTVTMEINKTVKTWLKLNSSYASEFGFFEFTNNLDNSSAKILLFKNGNDVKLNIKTESK